MTDSAPRTQHISQVYAQQGARAYVGTFNNCQFGGAGADQKASEQAARVCHNALFLTDPEVDRESVISAKGKKVAGTCEWILQDESCRAWLNIDGDGAVDDNARLLWISGGPGKGKTMMSIFLTEELQKHAAGMDNADLAFFFCSAEDEKRNTAIAVLRALVHQIIIKRPQMTRHALPYFETSERTQQTLSSLETLWIIFSRLVADAELGTMFCVLDGLDECDDSTMRVLLPRLVDLLTSEAPSASRGTFKLAIVSRDLPGLQGCRRIRLDPDNDEKVASDIQLFVSVRVHELSKTKGFDDEFRASVQTALLERAQGTFLWVGFAMDELSRKQTCSEIWGALNDLPSGLPAIYGHMLQRIPAKQRDVSGAILRWVTLAVRPLTVQELAGAVGIQSSSPQISLERASRDAIALCEPLVKVQEQKQVVSLVHQSARDYLVRAERDSDAVLEAFRIKTESSHLELAQTCLRCIAESSLQHTAIDLDDESDTQEPPLLRYAALHWPEHARSCSTHAKKLFKLSGFFFQEENPLRIYWWETYNKEREEYRCKPPPLLHMACTLEILPWVQAVLAKNSWRPRLHRRVNKKDERGETGLHLAADRGNEAVVRLLVERGADVKARDVFGKTVLHSAAWEGNEAVVRLLVERGADVRVKDKNRETMLHSAADRGNATLVRLLVDRGADVNAKDIYGKTILHSAAEGGNEAVVRLLVERGADVNAKDKDGRAVLHSAAEKGNATLVRLLVDRGADVNAKDMYGSAVLHSVASRGNEAMVRLLVEKGADVEAKDNNAKYTR